MTVAATAATALVLAGGRATRLGGIDKLAVVIAGATILDRLRAVLAPRVAEIVIATPRDVAGHRCVRDLAGDGPLAGIAAGLAACATPWLVVVAGDMPYLTGALVDRILAACGDADAAVARIDAVGVRHAGRPEPLVCALRVAPARAAVARRLASGRYKASGLLADEDLQVTWVDEPDARTLVNVNTPADLC